MWMLFYNEGLKQLFFFVNYQSETIAVNVHNLDLGIVLQILAQFGNIHVHTAAIEVGVAAPDALQRLFAG